MSSSGVRLDPSLVIAALEEAVPGIVEAFFEDRVVLRNDDGLVPDTDLPERLQETGLSDDDARRLGRSPELVQHSRLRIDSTRLVPGLAHWAVYPTYFVAVALGPSDSTWHSPNTLDGGPIGGPNEYIRAGAGLAITYAEENPDVRVELDVLDFHAYGEDHTGDGGADQSSWVIGPNYPQFQTRRVLNEGAGECYSLLPGSTDQYLWLPLTDGNRLYGSEPMFFGFEGDVPTPGGATVNHICLDKGTGDFGVRIGINAAGLPVAVTSVNGGAGSVNNPGTVAPTEHPDGRGCWGILVTPDDGNGHNTYQFFECEPGTRWRNPQPLGDTYVRNGTFTWHNPDCDPNEQEGWAIGALSNGGGLSSTYGGKIYDVQIRRGGIHGPSILPEHPSAWGWSRAGLAPNHGGPCVRFIDASRPGWGCNDFLPDHTMDTEARPYSPSPVDLMLPLLPYAAVFVNTAHNDADLFGEMLYDALDQVAAEVEHRAPGATIVLSTQNPTDRDDGPGSNPDSRRIGGTHRAGLMAAWADSRGYKSVDPYTTFEDYIRGCADGTREPVAFKPDGTTPGDGDITDLVDEAPGGQRGVHPQGFRDEGGAGVRLMVNKIYEEAFGMAVTS